MLVVVAAGYMARRNVLHVLDVIVVVVPVVVTAEGMARHVFHVLRVLVAGRVEEAGEDVTGHVFDDLLVVPMVLAAEILVGRVLVVL